MYLQACESAYASKVRTTYMVRELPHAQEPARRELGLCAVCPSISSRKPPSDLTTHVFNNSGSVSPSCSLYGSSTKLIFVICVAGTLFCSRHSSSHSGIASSSARASCPVLDTCPRYSVSHPAGASSEIRIAVCGGMGTLGVSLDDGGVMGPESKTCAAVFAAGWAADSYQVFRREQGEPPIDAVRTGILETRLTPELAPAGAAAAASPDGAAPAVSLAWRFVLFPNALMRPIKLPIVGVLGDCIPSSAPPPAAPPTLFPPHPEKSSGVGVGAVEVDEHGHGFRPDPRLVGVDAARGGGLELHDDQRVPRRGHGMLGAWHLLDELTLLLRDLLAVGPARPRGDLHDQRTATHLDAHRATSSGRCRLAQQAAMSSATRG